MKRTHAVFAVLVLVAAASVIRPSAAAQSTLPATGPTQANTVAPLTATATVQDAATRAHHAEVLYASGMLSINANNSSLNLILREIAKQTGMKITGGVAEERVFGHYGPAQPADILITLLDGTGTNMLLRQNDADAPVELVLTPRNGGATPPNPNAPGFDDQGVEPSDEQAATPQPQRPAGPAQRFSGSQNIPFGVPPQNTYPPVQSGPPQSRTSANPSIPLPANNINGSSANVTPTASQLPTTNSVPLDSLATPSTTPPSTGIVDTPNPANSAVVNPIQQNAQAIGAAAANGQPVAAPATDASLPAGAKTPEQIFQQLQQMRQQQQQQPQNGTTITPSTPPSTPQ